jgi:hypothetical protein
LGQGSSWLDLPHYYSAKRRAAAPFRCVRSLTHRFGKPPPEQFQNRDAIRISAPLRYLFSSWLTSDILSLALRARMRVQIRSRRICRRATRGCALLPRKGNPRGAAARPDRGVVRAGQGGPGRLPTEVKRSVASHEGGKCPGRPLGQERSWFEDRRCGRPLGRVVSESARVPYTARVCRK